MEIKVKIKLKLKCKIVIILVNKKLYFKRKAYKKI